VQCPVLPSAGRCVLRRGLTTSGQSDEPHRARNSLRLADGTFRTERLNRIAPLTRAVRGRSSRLAGLTGRLGPVTHGPQSLDCGGHVSKWESRSVPEPSERHSRVIGRQEFITAPRRTTRSTGAASRFSGGLSSGARWSRRLAWMDRTAPARPRSGRSVRWSRPPGGGRRLSWMDPQRRHLLEMGGVPGRSQGVSAPHVIDLVAH
jgi:hypothetical protein